MKVIKRGDRPLVDCLDRRELSVLRIGYKMLAPLKKGIMRLDDPLHVAVLTFAN